MLNKAVVRTMAVAAGLAACHPASAQTIGAQIAGEKLVPPAEPGFAPAVVQQRRSVFMSESVPKGETLDLWSRMVTVERFPWQPGLAVDALAGSLGEGFAGECPGTILTPVHTLDAGGHPAADLRADCPRNPQTGKPETMFARFVLGDEMIHMVQVAFRHTPTPDEAAWAERTLAGTILCKRSSGDPACK